MPQEFLVADVGLRVGETILIHADKVDIDEMAEHHGWTDRLVKQLTSQSRLWPLNKDNFQKLFARRPADAAFPPRGFTTAFLKEAGYIDDAPTRRGQAAAPGRPPVPKVTRVEKVVLTDEKIPVGPCYIQPRKVGRFTYFDVADAEGGLLRDKGFRDVDKARAFLAELSPIDPAADTSGLVETPAPAPAETKAEAPDGDNLQRGPV